MSFSPDSGVAGDGITNANHITLAGTAAAGSTVEVFDGATQIGTAVANGSGAWTFATGTLADGSHAFTTKAMDAAGNLSTASAALTVTVDTVTPAAPRRVASFSSDSNVAGDGITNVNHVTLAGTAVAGSTVEVFDGATQIGTATADGSGAWTYATGTLTDGGHAFTSKAMDAAGNVSAASAALNVTVDTAAPGTPVLISDANVTPTTISVTGGAEAGSTVRLFEGATLLGTTVANASGTWNITTGPLSPGSHDFTATATDAAGNVSPISDILDPVIEPVAAPTGMSFSPDSNVVGDGITNVNHITVSGMAAANEKVQLFDGATLIGTITANASGAWSFATSTLTSGTHAFTSKAIDSAGNVSATSAVLNVTVDTTAPAKSTIAGFSPDTNKMGDGITDANHITLTGTAEANGSVQVFDGTTKIGTAAVNSSGAWSFYTTGTLADGTHSFTSKAVDAAGNVGVASTVLKVTIDTVAPTAPKTVSFSPDSNVVGDGTTNVNHVTLKGTAVAGSTVQVFDGATQIGTTTASSTGAWSFATGTLVDGTHAFTSKAMDVAGNLSTASAALNVTIDTATPGAPTVTSFSPDSNVFGDGITNANHVTLAGTADANSTVKVFDGTRQIGTVTANSTGDWTFATATLTNATHAFTAKEMDVAGNLSAASAALNVTVDTTAPAKPTIAGFSPDTNAAGDHITNVDHITLTGTAVAGSTVEVFDGAIQIGTAIANGGGAWSFATATLADGSHSFTDKAMDAAGNVSAASTALKVTIDTATPATISAGATLELAQADGGLVKFNGSTGTLILDNSSTFTGKILNLSGNGNLATSDHIDLKDIAFGAGTSESYSGNTSGGVLTITDAQNHTANLSLVGDFTNSTFVLSGDGHGGTIVIDGGFNFASSPSAANGPISPSVVVAGMGNDAFVFHQAAGGVSGTFDISAFENSDLIALLKTPLSDLSGTNPGHDASSDHSAFAGIHFAHMDHFLVH